MHKAPACHEKLGHFNAPMPHLFQRLVLNFMIMFKIYSKKL